MNYFAHLTLAQPNTQSTVGNLLGDFARGVDIGALPSGIRNGLLNHRAVDRYTDQDPRISSLKRLFSPERRRFAGIALDIYFDHLLINYWSELRSGDVEVYIGECYQRITSAQSMMPSRHMNEITQRMVRYDWFGGYRQIDAVAMALDRVAGRIRFANRFGDAIEDLQRHHDEIVESFLSFYPELQRHITRLALESDFEDSGNSSVLIGG